MRHLAVTLAIICGSVSIHAQDHHQFWGIEKERALGAQLASQVRSSTTSLGLVEVDKYVQNLVRRLAKQMPDARGEWEVSVIRDRRIGLTREPIALPGGYVFVSTLDSRGR